MNDQISRVLRFITRLRKPRRAKSKPVGELSYHDVIVYVENVPHVISNFYGYELSYTRVGGWQLYSHGAWHSKQEGTLIGGEFDGPPFRIEVNGIVILDTAQRKNED